MDSKRGAIWEIHDKQEERTLARANRALSRALAASQSIQRVVQRLQLRVLQVVHRVLQLKTHKTMQ